MKRKIELTCASCGVKFTAEADYITPGIQGYVTNSKGEVITCIDPNEPHQCGDCIDKAIELIKT